MRKVELIHQDMKEYTEGKFNYTVSQIEVDGTDEILRREKEFLEQLEFEKRSHGAIFSSLLVTDITTLSSVFMIASDSVFESQFKFPKKSNHIYYLKDVMSRKKQLIPLISELLSSIDS